MEAGKISKWLFKEGDEITIGDVVADIETDKSTVGFEMVDEGYIAKFLYPEGADGIKVGSPMMIIVEEENLVKEFANISLEDLGMESGSSEVQEVDKEVSAE